MVAPWTHEPDRSRLRNPSLPPIAEQQLDAPVTAAHAVQVAAPARPLPAIVRYGIGVVVVAASFGLSAMLGHLVAQAPFILFWPAVLGIAVFLGAGPAILASVLSVIAVAYWFIEPRRSLKLEDPATLFPLITFAVAASVVSVLADRRRIAERRAADAARANADLAARIEEQSVEIETQLEESQAMAEELEQTSVELAERTAEAEAARRYSQEIVQSIGDPFVVQDSEWRFTFINDAAMATFARNLHGDPHDYLGRSVWEVYPELIGTKFETEMRRAARERIPVQFEAFYAEQGNWAQLSCYPMPDGGLATQWRNITARKKAEEAFHYLDRTTQLLTSPLDPEERLADLARLVVPDLADWCGVDIVNHNGDIEQVAVAHVDPAKVEWARELNRRYPPKPDAATGVPNVIRTGQPELVPEVTDEMLVAVAVDADHLRLVREIGLRSAMVVPLTARGRTFGALTLITAESRRRYAEDDLALVTEMARRAALAIDSARQHQQALDAQRQAENANLAKSQFLAAMSHELRTPLNAIGGYTQLLAMGVRGPISDMQRADLERIEQSQRHLLGLINDVLEFARIEAGRVEYHLAPLPVTSLISELEDFVRPQLRERSLGFHCEQPPPEVHVRADADKTRQILLNLLSNAVKFTPRTGHIEVRCEQNDGRVFIRVTDTGIGIAPERLGSIFEPFVQVHRSLTEPTGGVGLGLAISRDLARAMHGDLTVASAVGKGSTFTLELPAATPR